MMRTTVLSMMAILTGCLSATDRFTEGRSAMLCEQSYYVCGVTAGCRLDTDHYLSGRFPGARRLLIETEDDDQELLLRLFLDEMVSPGTELVAQLYEPDCSLDTSKGRTLIVDTDLFQEAGEDRTIELVVEAQSPGEHLLELYSDA
ncbi:MAG: hypothetical protein AAFV53_03755, partial [Myxococcota bacterium]